MNINLLSAYCFQQRLQHSDSMQKAFFRSVEMKIGNVVGKRFGRLVVTEQNINDQKVLCKCDCGTLKRIAKGSLVKGYTKSCGCLSLETKQSRMQDRSNTRLDKLQVLTLNNKTRKWICLCDCGKTVEKTGGYLSRSHIKSCGCHREYINRKGINLYHQLISKSEGRYPMLLTYEDFVEFMNTTHCRYCGKSINWKQGHAYNLDRVNNKIGYTVDNCVVCCALCNRAKYTLSQQDFLEHVKCIYETSCRN